MGPAGPIGRMWHRAPCAVVFGSKGVSCYHPIPAVRLDNGAVSLHSKDASAGRPLELPCGTCFGCRSDRAREWALRAECEAQCWDSNYFVTMTYDEDHCPPLMQLQPLHVQKFLKRVRKRFVGHQAVGDRRPIRFLASGEYGDDTARPHYHVLLFNLLLSDVEPYGRTEYVVSPSVQQLWPYGQVLIGEVEPGSCAYVAGYALKKLRRLEREIELVDPATGECMQYQPPFARHSRRPGLGQFWYDKYQSDLRRGYVQVHGSRRPIPRCWRERLQRDHPDWIEDQEFLAQERAWQQMRVDPTYFYKRSSIGRETAEERDAIRRRLLQRPKQL